MKPEKGKKKDRPVSSPKKEESSGSLSFISGLFFNIMGAAVAGVFLYVIFNYSQGYDWLLNTMLKGNFETMEQNPPDPSVAQRYEIKWGGRIGMGEISYVNRIKDQTPDSATSVP